MMKNENRNFLVTANKKEKALKEELPLGKMLLIKL